MKYKFIILFFSLIIITGCDKTKLVCEKKEKNPGYDYYEQYEFLYNENGNELEKIKTKVEAKYNELYTEEEIEEEYNSVKNLCSLFDLSEQKYVDCNVEVNGNIITVDTLMKVEEISEESFNNFMYVTKEEVSNKKDTKKLLKNVGYTCE